MQQQQQQQLTTVSVGHPTTPAGFVTAPPGQQVFFVSPRPDVSRVPSAYKHRQSTFLGITLIITGALSIVFNIVDLAVGSTPYDDDHYNADYSYYYSLGFIGHGFWSGTMSIIAGGFGIGAAYKKSICQIRAFLVMCIFAACCCLAQLGTAIAGASVVGTTMNGCCQGNCYPNEAVNGCTIYETLIAMEALLAILALIGGIAALWGSALGCLAACCCSCCCCREVNPSFQPVGMMQYSLPITQIQQQQQQQLQPGVFMVPASSVQYPAPAYIPPATTAGIRPPQQQRYMESTPATWNLYNN